MPTFPLSVYYRLDRFGPKGSLTWTGETRKSYFMDTSGLSRLYFNILTGHFIFPQPCRLHYFKAITRFYKISGSRDRIVDFSSIYLLLSFRIKSDLQSNRVKIVPR